MLHVDDDDALEATAAALRSGQVVVLPTDTVYGLAARPDDVEAVGQIFRAKGRPDGMHLPVLAASPAQVRALGVEETAASRALGDRWWPGPLTLVFGFDPEAGRPSWLVGRCEVAVRIPQHAFLLALLQRTGVLLVTSANPHGSPTPPSASEVAEVLGSGVGPVVDGGLLGGAVSTLVNVGHGEAVVEREGAIPARSVRDTVAAAREAP